MRKNTELFIGLRRSNGQIGYLSEGLKIPEFFELILEHDNRNPALVDFAPVIEKLHNLHCKQNDEKTRNKYNSIYNYWQDAKTYTKESIKLSRSEQLSCASNELINELQIRLREKKKCFYASQNDQKLIIDGLKEDCDMYIDVLLCFIHSKASLEIESFRRDNVLRAYSDFLEELLFELFSEVIQSGRDGESFFKYLAFESNGDLQTYLELIHPGKSEDQFLLSVIKNSKRNRHWDERFSYYNQVVIDYEIFNQHHIEMARILRDLLYKIRSISKLLSSLKEKNVEWAPNESTEHLFALLE
ncbi:hypothetical protein [Nitrosomonas sp. Nm132]|uniref:hypothetical protein n=1 Tax=Nitrosomonas sp. Nm132 TaxID=1881053 RepID=UPI000888ADB7|nr:hypothetical protein [Nitrosomonas sp. Nm132]SDH05932.1 hypothetical protein SAMN05428952_1004123 [Nitrosomonas sp. Nm132]